MRAPLRLSLGCALGFVLLFGPACLVATDTDVLPAPERPLFQLAGVTLPVATGAMPEALQPLDGAIVLRFSDLPEPATVVFPNLRLATRTSSVESLLSVDLVRAQIVVRSRNRLRPFTDYSIELGTDLRALSGAPLDRPYSVRFRTGDTILPPPSPEPVVTLDQLFGVSSPLRSRCALSRCHKSEPGLPAASSLDLGGDLARIRQVLLTAQRRGGPDQLLLVEPGRPATSYLLRKLLMHKGHTRADGLPMPPPPQPPLDEATLLDVQRYIEQGADL